MVVAIIFYQQQAAMGRRCPTAHFRWRSARPGWLSTPWSTKCWSCTAR